MLRVRPAMLVRLELLAPVARPEPVARLVLRVRPEPVALEPLVLLRVPGRRLGPRPWSW